MAFLKGRPNFFFEAAAAAAAAAALAADLLDVEARYCGVLARAWRALADDVVAVHAPGTSLTLPDSAFQAGRYLRAVGLVPEPLRNRGWSVYAFHIPRRDAGTEPTR